QRGVRDVLELQADGAVDFGAVMAVDVDPQGRDGVEVLAPPRIEQPGAAGVVDDHRLVARQRLDPGLHLRERMPEVRPAERGVPVTTGKIAEASRAGRPASRSPAAKRRTLLHRRERRASPSLPARISSDARAAQASAGGSAVEKMSGRARFSRRSQTARLAATYAPATPKAFDKVAMRTSAATPSSAAN